MEKVWVLILQQPVFPSHLVRLSSSFPSVLSISIINSCSCWPSLSSMSTAIAFKSAGHTPSVYFPQHCLHEQMEWSFRERRCLIPPQLSPLWDFHCAETSPQIPQGRWDSMLSTTESAPPPSTSTAVWTAASPAKLPGIPRGHGLYFWDFFYGLLPFRCHFTILSFDKFLWQPRAERSLPWHVVP